MAYQAVHDPFEAPEDYIKMYKHIHHGVRKRYAAMVTYMDYSVGRIVDALKERGLWNNTVLVFSTGKNLSMSALKKTISFCWMTLKNSTTTLNIIIAKHGVHGVSNA